LHNSLRRPALRAAPGEWIALEQRDTDCDARVVYVRRAYRNATFALRAGISTLAAFTGSEAVDVTPWTLAAWTSEASTVVHKDNKTLLAGKSRAL